VEDGLEVVEGGITTGGHVGLDLDGRQLVRRRSAARGEDSFVRHGVDVAGEDKG
jgi:hypothetical protein